MKKQVLFYFSILFNVTLFIIILFGVNLNLHAFLQYSTFQY